MDCLMPLCKRASAQPDEVLQTNPSPVCSSLANLNTSLQLDLVHQEELISQALRRGKTRTAPQDFWQKAIQLNRFTFGKSCPAWRKGNVTFCIHRSMLFFANGGLSGAQLRSRWCSRWAWIYCPRACFHSWWGKSGGVMYDGRCSGSVSYIRMCALPYRWLVGKQTHPHGKYAGYFIGE